MRAARVLLAISQQDLAAAAGVSVQTLRDIENGSGDPRRSSLTAVEDYLVSWGVRFVADPLVVGMPATSDDAGQAPTEDERGALGR